MKNTTAVLALSFGVACVSVLAACGDDDDGGSVGPVAGAAGKSTAGAAGSVPKAGAGGESEEAGAGGNGTAGNGATGGTIETAGTGGVTAGSGGTTAGTGGAEAGSSGAPMANPLIVTIDSFFIRAKGSAGGAGGTGGAAGSGGASAGTGGTAGSGGASAGTGGTAGSDAGSGGTAGSTAGTAGTAGSSAGAGGAPPNPIGTPRSYTFETTTAPWALNPYGSTPGIGQLGGGEKLSALSLLAINATEGSPTPGSAQITAPFMMGSEQLDLNQGVAPDENWSGFEIVAKIKVLAAGKTPTACMGAWLYTTSAGYPFGRGPEVFIKPGDWVDLRFDLDNPAALGEDRGTQLNWDKTAINQVGLQLETWRCP